MCYDGRKLNLAFIIASLGAGGAERVATQLCNSWAAAGHSVSLVTFEPASNWRGYDIGPSIQLVRIDATWANAGLISAIISNVRRVARLRRVLRAISPDVTIAFITETNVLALFAGVGAPWATIVSERIHAPSHPVGTIWHMLRWLSYRFADAIVVQTDAMADWVRGQCGIIAEIIPNPVDLGSFRGSYETIEETPRLLLVAVGRLEHQKGHDLLIRAFSESAAQLDAWDLDIYGEGSQRDALQELSHSLGMSDRIKFRGVVANIGAVYERAAAVVHPARYEGYPNVLAEALAAGKPIIATDCPGATSELLGGGQFGVLIPSDNVEALRNALVNNLSTSEKLLALRQAARSADTLHSPGDISARWLSLIDRALGRRRRKL